MVKGENMKENEELQKRINNSIDYINQILDFVISENIEEEQNECLRLKYLKDLLEGKNEL